MPTRSCGRQLNAPSSMWAAATAAAVAVALTAAIAMAAFPPAPRTCGSGNGGHCAVSGPAEAPSAAPVAGSSTSAEQFVAPCCGSLACYCSSSASSFMRMVKSMSPVNMIYYLFVVYRFYILLFNHLLLFIAASLHHLLQYAIWEYSLPFIPYITNGVFHLLPFIPFITRATWRCSTHVSRLMVWLD